MKKATTASANPTWIARILDAVDHALFRAIDLDATARGWQVRRDSWFSRTYRDPRFDSLSPCAACAGSGGAGAGVCPECEGNGTIWSGSDENVHST
ncbi:hypothetical protein [Pseudonocardia nigra]|uniref:hypothetical protein n=1 Tax=Pseudonocardia nigra TaxID=1921578 RepID=UPI001C5EA5FB|nr:hypothetical protein [Pseudonocardia nigra]